MKRQKNLKFSNRALESLPKPLPGSSSPSVEYSCAQLPRLVAAVFQNGTISFRVKGKVKGRRLSYTFGHFPTWNVEQAMERAKELLRQIDQGIDPRNHGIEKNGLTVREFIKEHFAPFVRSQYKSAKNSLNMLEKRILPYFGDMLLAEVTKKNIAAFLQALEEEISSTTRNRYQAFLSSMFKQGIELEYLDVNPCQGIKKGKENKSRDRYLHPDEFQRFIEFLVKNLDKLVYKFMFMLICTGMRKGELLPLQWSDINFSDATIYLSDPKNGQSRYVTVNSVALDLLTKMYQQRRRSCPWVFPSKNSESGHLIDIRRAFKSACDTCSIRNLRPHDLRRSHAVQLLNAGVDHLIIKEILGHKSLQSTMVYARASNASLTKSSEIASDLIRGAMND